MNALFDGFDPDALMATLILLVLCALIFLVQQIEFEPGGPISEDSLPFPAPVPGESPSLHQPDYTLPPISSVQALHRLAEARSDWMRARRVATPQEVRAAQRAHYRALSAYLDAVAREVRP